MGQTDSSETYKIRRETAVGTQLPEKVYKSHTGSKAPPAKIIRPAYTRAHKQIVQKESQ